MLYAWNQHNTVNQLYFNLKNKIIMFKVNINMYKILKLNEI